MSEILEAVGLKTCSKCGQTLPISAFGKEARTKDGLRHNCKSCRNNANKLWYENTIEERHEYKKNYNKNTWAIRRANDPIYKRKDQVHNLTRHAIDKGILTRPDACPECGANDRTIEAHHWSYELGNELDVLWLCRKCHAALHQRNKID